MDFRFAALLLLAFSNVAMTERDAPSASRTLAFATYYERSENIVVVVDSVLAFQRAEEAFIPIRVLVLVDRAGTHLNVERGSFGLADSTGQIHPSASADAVRQGYGKEDFDASVLSRLSTHVGQWTVNCWRIDSRFYPGASRELRLDHVELSGFTWLEDVIYFPRPVSGLDGVLTLHFAPDGLRVPIALRFTIPVK